MLGEFENVYESVSISHGPAAVVGDGANSKSSTACKTGAELDHLHPN